jgi:CubicO group peptidase (beta-lactamase class C family)
MGNPCDRETIDTPPGRSSSGVCYSLPSDRGLTRREWLTTTALGLAFTTAGHRAQAQPTGRVDPKLAAYDELMSSFMREHRPPGAALAVTYQGRLVYARGFGHADLEKHEPVEPGSLFRIASISKPFTATAVLRLVAKGRLKLDDPVFPLLKLKAHLERGARVDARLHDIRVHHCLQHTAGWDRDKTFDPMGAETAEQVARALEARLPIRPRQIIEFMMGKPLDFAPGTRYVYSNFGYCVLGRVIEAVSGKSYHDFVSHEILAPLGIRRMRLGKNLLRDRAPGEVKYYDGKQRTGRAISGPQIGKQVPLPYGVECIESMDANGGWIASAVDLVRFAVAFDDPKKCPVLDETRIHTMLGPPPGLVGHQTNGKPKESYYACGWDVRPSEQRHGACTKWHGGGLAGSSTLLVCRDDGINWAVLFNSDAGKDGKAFADLIDPLLHKPASEIKNWPEVDLFPRLLRSLG